MIPSTAAAQGEDDEWASSSGGHLAFLNQNDGVSTLRSVDADGQQSASVVVSTGYADPLVAPGARGDAIVVWYDSEKRSWARYRQVGGVLGAQEPVAADVDRFVEAVTLGLDAAGTATVTWVPETADEQGGLQVRTRTEAGAWSAPQNLGGYRVFAPELAVTDNGSAVLAWRQSRSPKRPNANQVAVSTRPPGGVFGPMSVLAGVQRNPSSPSVAANDRGDAVVGWSELHRDRRTRPRFQFSVHAASAPSARGLARRSSSTEPATWPARGSPSWQPENDTRFDRTAAFSDDPIRSTPKLPCCRPGQLDSVRSILRRLRVERPRRHQAGAGDTVCGRSMEISDSASMRRIVVGVRPQGVEPWVIKAAAELAQQTGAAVAVVSVDELETEMLSTVPRSEVTARAEHVAAEAVERLREAGVEAAMEVRAGRPFEQIIGFADEQDADLIVVGTSSRSRLASALLGSVPLSLVRSSRRPVLVVSAPESG